MPEPVLLSWSGGKDSAMTLYTLQQAEKYVVAGLLTTVTEEYDRISMGGVRRELLDQQADALGLPVHIVSIPPQCSNEEYGKRMETALQLQRQRGIEKVAFGDIFLEDLRQYRESNLAKMALQGVFPIWKRDTRELAQTFISLGFKAVVTCVDTSVLDGAFAGRMIDDAFLRDLPPDIDPCGENGEFHSFVFDGPIFKRALNVSPGERVLRDNRFYFCDVIPNGR